MQIMNHLDESVFVLWSEGNETPSTTEIGSVRNGQTLPIPLSCFDYPKGGFFLKPDVPE